MGVSRGGRGEVVRVVDLRERSVLGFAATLLATLGLFALLLDDVMWGTLLPRLGALDQPLAAVLFALAAMGPWLRAPVHPRRARARIDEGRGAVRLGRRTIRGREVVAVSVAPAEHGVSVGVRRYSGRTTFLEVANLATAHAIARALGAGDAPGAKALPGRHRAPFSRAGAVFTTAVIVTSGAISVTGTLGVAWAEGLRSIGVVGVLFAPVALAFAAVPAFRRWATLTETPWDAHVALHAASADASSGPTAETRPREPGLAGVLARGEEPATAWLARLDALPREASAYRGDTLAREALLAVVRDESATPDARAGAARLLALRYEEPPRTLVRVVADPDVRLRVEAAIEADPEDAADELERLGPLFRAR